jgi:hypothetical protein
MLGGGFLRQMNETIKLNRENLKKNKKNPFEKGNSAQEHGQIFLKERIYSESYRKELLEKLKADQRRERSIQLFVGIFLIVSISMIVYFFGAALKQAVIDFLN